MHCTDYLLLFRIAYLYCTSHLREDPNPKNCLKPIWDFKFRFGSKTHICCHWFWHVSKAWFLFLEVCSNISVGFVLERTNNMTSSRFHCVISLLFWCTLVQPRSEYPTAMILSFPMILLATSRLGKAARHDKKILKEHKGTKRAQRRRRPSRARQRTRPRHTAGPLQFWTNANEIALIPPVLPMFSTPSRTTWRLQHKDN